MIKIDAKIKHLFLCLKNKKMVKIIRENKNKMERKIKKKRKQKTKENKNK